MVMTLFNEAPKLSQKFAGGKAQRVHMRQTLKFGACLEAPRGGSRRSLTKEANICITKPGDKVNGKQSKLSLKRFWSFVSPSSST